MALTIPRRRKSVYESANKKFGDILVEGRKEKETVILHSLEDIGKVADVLAKPVIRDGNSYKVYDNSITYEFKPIETEDQLANNKNNND